MPVFGHYTNVVSFAICRQLSQATYAALNRLFRRLRLSGDHARPPSTEQPSYLDPPGNPFKITLTVLRVGNIAIVDEQRKQLDTRRFQSVSQFSDVAII